MDYTFSETEQGKIILTTIGKTHTNFSGWQEFSTEYPDSVVNDKFFIVSHIKSDKDSEDNCYDWYLVNNHYRQIDKTPPLSKSISDNDIMTVDQEYRLSLIEVNMPSPIEKVGPDTKLKPGLYDTMVRMIERVQTDGLEEKIDIFYATGAISETEYNDLLERLHHAEPESEVPTEEVVK